MAAVLMRVFLEDVINVAASTARLITNQGLEDFDELKDFSEEDMRTLCNTIRRPGGSIPNPRAAQADQPPTIRDPGSVISMVAEKRLVMTAYAAMHQTRTSRPITPATMTRAHIMSLSPLRDLEKSYATLASMEKPTTNYSMSKWLEALDDFLLKVRGVQKCPLAYCTRESATVQAHATDPSTGYSSIDMEMISRAPHDLYVYAVDNRALWHILHDALKDHPAYTSIRSFARTQDGRQAYQALVLHNLGESRNHTVLEEAEDNLANIFYTEEKLKFTFDRFVEIHRSAHNNMLSVPNYIAPNPATRVRKLLSNIRSTNPTLLAALACVQTSPTLRNDFELTVDTIQSAVRASKVSNNRKQRISALTGGTRKFGGRGGGGGNGRYQGNKRRGNGGRGGRGRNGGRGDNKRVRFSDSGDPPAGVGWVEDKFYEPTFYAKFTAEQKAKLHELRNDRNPRNSNISSLETRLQQLEQIAGQVTPPTETRIIAPVITNGNNPALQRLNQRAGSQS